MKKIIACLCYPDDACCSEDRRNSSRPESNAWLKGMVWPDSQAARGVHELSRSHPMTKSRTTASSARPSRIMWASFRCSHKKNEVRSSLVVQSRICGSQTLRNCSLVILMQLLSSWIFRKYRCQKMAAAEVLT